MNNKTWYKAGEAADYLHISYQTLAKYSKQGKIEFTITPGGQRTYTKAQLDKYAGNDTTQPNEQRLAFYVRDSQGNTERLKRQANTLEKIYGKPIKTYSDKASGLNENRKGLQQLLKDTSTGKINTIAITAKDRLTRFGYTYLEQLLKEHNTTILVLNEQQDKNAYDELIQDFLALLASFSGKYYKLRGLKHEKMLLKKAEQELDKKNNPQTGQNAQ